MGDPDREVGRADRKSLGQIQSSKSLVPYIAWQGGSERGERLSDTRRGVKEF